MILRVVFEAFTLFNGHLIVWMHVVFLLIGWWCAAEFFFRLALSSNLNLDHLRDHGFLYLIAFGVAGRLLAIVAIYQAYMQDPMRIFIVWDGGFSFLGGCIGVGVVLFFVTRDQRATFLQWLDVLLPATTLGLAFEWLGNLMAAQSYGKPTNSIFGVVFDTLNGRYAVPIHPVQLYYTIFYLVLTFLLLIIRKNAKRAGSETLVGIVLSSVAVFMLEFFRGDSAIPVFANVMDFIFLGCLFVSLGVLAAIELRLSERGNMIYGACVGVLTVAYVIGRRWFDFGSVQLRFSQVLAVLALLATVVYVVVHRRKYPYL
jgi:phosphatidylglycerol:prolipoprotein diacylglycerol transferase